MLPLKFSSKKFSFEGSRPEKDSIFDPFKKFEIKIFIFEYLPKMSSETYGRCPKGSLKNHDTQNLLIISNLLNKILLKKILWVVYYVHTHMIDLVSIIGEGGIQLKSP